MPTQDHVLKQDTGVAVNGKNKNMKAIDKFILHVVHNWKSKLTEVYGERAMKNFIAKFKE